MMGHLGERLTALIDGELGHTERDRAFKHLASCDSCRAEADALRRLKRRIGALSEPKPSGDLMSALFELSEPGEPLRPPPPRRLPSAGMPIEAELYGIDALRTAGTADATPGRSLPPAAAAAAFLGLTGNEPLGSRPFGSGGLGRAAALGESAPLGGGVMAPPSGRAMGALRLRARNVMIGAAAAAAIAVGTAFFVGGDDESAPVVTPPIDMYAAEHASTSGDVVLTNNASGGTPAAPVYAHRTQTQFLAPAAHRP